MANKRKYISTEYGTINLRDGDQIIHLDPEVLAELYWEVQDSELVRVVRCKDCTAYIPFKDEKGGVCTMHREFEHTFPDDYCSRGERKEDAETN